MSATQLRAMAIRVCAVVAGVTIAAGACQPVWALSTAFTYQGQLLRNGAPVSDTCSFQFTLTDSSGTTVATTSPATLPVTVAGGLFAVSLDIGTRQAIAGLDR